MKTSKEEIVLSRNNKGLCEKHSVKILIKVEIKGQTPQLTLIYCGRAVARTSDVTSEIYIDVSNFYSFMCLQTAFGFPIFSGGSTEVKQWLKMVRLIILAVVADTSSLW